jgi:hypothetical protein
MGDTLNQLLGKVHECLVEYVKLEPKNQHRGGMIESYQVLQSWYTHEGDQGVAESAYNALEQISLHWGYMDSTHLDRDECISDFSSHLEEATPEDVDDLIHRFASEVFNISIDSSNAFESKRAMLKGCIELASKNVDKDSDRVEAMCARAEVLLTELRARGGVVD